MYYLGIASNGEYMQFLLIDENAFIHAQRNEKNNNALKDENLKFKSIIELGIARICVEADILLTDIGFAFLAIPSYGENELADKEMNRVLTNIFRMNNFICESDIEAAWTGALAGDPGITLLAGMGSVGIGKNSTNDSHRVSGWGRLCGDEGGEYWLAKKSLEIFTKEADSRYNDNILYKLLLEKTSLQTDHDIVNLSFENIDAIGIKFYELVNILFEAAKLGDVYAIKSIKEAAYEYFLMIKAILKNVNFESEVKISHIGRIFKEEYLLIEYLKEYLENLRGYKYRFILPQLSLVSGAALQALLFKEKLSVLKVNNLLKEERRIIEESKFKLYIYY